jgi:hypothetical protein
MADDNEKRIGASGQGSVERQPEEPEDKANAARPPWLQVFRQAFEKARREQGEAPSRRELGRDRSRTLFLLVGAAIAVLVLFLVVFSSPDSIQKRLLARGTGTPSLGRRVTPGQQKSQQAGSVTPLLNATPQTAETQSTQTITPEDVGRTARPEQAALGTPPIYTPPPSPTTLGHPGKYALGGINFSGVGSSSEPACEISPRQPGAIESSANSEASKDLRKPSLIFVRSVSPATASATPQVSSANLDESTIMTELPAGTRLVARLQSAVSTAVRAPVVAAIEYNYERDGEIVVPAGTLALGKLSQADPSGDVDIDFDALQMPDGTTDKIDATAMSLNYGPLKGHVSGKGTAKGFLVRSLTGVGTVAAYLVGAGGGTGFNGPLSESSLLRDRIASNIGMAGDQELNSLAFNQHVVVTIPGNTRFFIVLEKGAVPNGAQIRPAAQVSESKSGALPTLDELRQLLQLKQELSDMVQQAGMQSAAAEPRQ